MKETKCNEMAMIIIMVYKRSKNVIGVGWTELKGAVSELFYDYIE